MAKAGRITSLESLTWTACSAIDDVTYLPHALAGLSVVPVGRLRSDRVMLRDPGPARSGPRGGRPHRHGGVLTFKTASAHPRPGPPGVSQRPRDSSPPGRPWAFNGMG